MSAPPSYSLSTDNMIWCPVKDAELEEIKLRQYVFRLLSPIISLTPISLSFCLSSQLFSSPFSSIHSNSWRACSWRWGGCHRLVAMGYYVCGKVVCIDTTIADPRSVVSIDSGGQNAWTRHTPRRRQMERAAQVCPSPPDVDSVSLASLMVGGCGSDVSCIPAWTQPDLLQWCLSRRCYHRVRPTKLCRGMLDGMEHTVASRCSSWYWHCSSSSLGLLSTDDESVSLMLQHCKLY